MVNISSVCRVVAILFLGSLSGGVATAQEVDHGLRDSLVLANKQLLLWNTARAKDLFAFVLRRDENSIVARIGLGKVAIQEGEWSEGCNIFDEVLDRDSANIVAHYHSGICRREYGTTVAWILRDRQWRKSAENFAWVMARDSAYEDVLYQFSLLLRYKKEYERAFDLAHRQIELRPDLFETRLGLFKLYRYYIAVEGSEETFALLTRRHDDFARYFAGEVLRRQNRLDEAERVFVELLGRPGQIPVQALYLSRARLCFAKGEPARGEELYWRGVDNITSWLSSAMVFEDLKYVVTDAELAAYRGIASDKKKELFFHAFWDLRNPTPAAKTNPRIAEHYRRLLYSEKNFEYYDFRNWFNNPDKMHYLQFPQSFALNQEFNDKGLIYIRHGDPDDIQRTMGDNLHESWLYQEAGESPRRIFHFAQANSVRSNWRLTSIPEDPQMLENLVSWDYRFQRLVRGGTLEQRSVVDELREESRVAVSSALATDEHTWKKESKIFSVPHSIDSFRGAQGKTLINVPIAIPIGSLKGEVSDTLKVMRVEVGISISLPGGGLIGSALDTLSFSLSPQATGSFVELYRFSLRPDSARISVHVYPIGTDLISIWNHQLRIPGYQGTQPTLSDIEFLLPSTARSSIDINGMKVIPSPFDAVPRNKPVYVYWQTYNLTRDANGKTRCKSEVLLTPGNSEPNDETATVYEKDHEGQEEYSAEFVQLDLSKYDRGAYTLTVRSTDRKMVYTFSKSRALVLTGD